ncbi:DUF4145 domain-containing protein [bacterium]|nr:DUF4145 domain-containing protein [bacterium]
MAIKELESRNITTQCPHCGDTVTLIPTHTPIQSHDHLYFVGLCPNHSNRHCRPIFAVYEFLNDRITSRYPIPSFDASNLHESIPESIRLDYAEARRCQYSSAFKGVVVLCRRVIEAIACNKLQDKSKDEKERTFKLFKLIDLLKDEGYITLDLKETAHELRHFGNYGAHMQDDGLDSVERDEANDIIEITWQFLYAIFVGPYKTKELKKKRLEKKS